ncbi:MAG: PASTA domain-containing protein [Bacteroidetes bacterium]|nr:PASTA domain-containing protein [Bacteroidota bacterium]
MKPKPLYKNPFLFVSAILLFALILALYYSVDQIVMPRMTRQDETITVPDLRDRPLSEALTEIEASSLVLGDTTSRIGLESQQGLIVSQRPRPLAQVKTGRRVYLTIYRGSEPDITIPDVTEQSLRNARLILEALGLVVQQEVPDTIPSPVPSMVTRIFPSVGTMIARGDSVTIFYGQGIDLDRMVTVPNVVGQRYAVADSLLRLSGLWPTLLDEDLDHDNPFILRQSTTPGETLPAGSTLRLFTTPNSLEF